MKRKISFAFSILVVLALALTAAGPALASGGAISDSTTARQTVDKAYALVQLKGAPLATYSKTKPSQGKKINFNSLTVKSYRAQLSAERNQFKQWMRDNRLPAKVTGQYDIALNAVAVKLNGTKLSQLRASPLVVKVEYEGLYYPNPASTDPDLSLINAFQAWAQGGGAPNAGAGIKVAIIDTGIDITHPCFSDSGYPAQAQLGNHAFTNNKVIAAKVFNNKTVSRGYTAEALQDHGTHVAGTVACNYNTPATVDGVSIPYGISGVAPRALLGNYNIFPGEVENARSEDILNALETAYADGFDIANMSLGGGASGIQDLLTMAVDDLDVANMVVAVAAGNDGPNHYTVESPGSAERALTAGAATVGHFIAFPIAVDGVIAAGIAGEFATVTSDLTAPLGVLTEAPVNSVTGLSTACTTLSTDLTGDIALLSRGDCSFSTKARNAQTAGAVAVVVVNHLAGDGIPMAGDGTPDQPTIPAYNISSADGAALKSHNGESTTISATPAYFVTGNDDFMADFSGEGPTDVDFRVKPDVVAPGVNVLSSIPHQFCDNPPCFAFFQGTSMATPHLAGSAAVVKQQHPTWSAAQIRSAIVNTADQGVLKKFTSTDLEPDVNIIGAGRENLYSAVNAMVAIDPVSLSFGAVPRGSGITMVGTIRLTNLTNSSKTFNLSIGSYNKSGVTYSASSSTVTIAAHASANVDITMHAAKGASLGDHYAKLTVKIGTTEVAHAVIYTFIK